MRLYGKAQQCVRLIYEICRMRCIIMNEEFTKQQQPWHTESLCCDIRPDLSIAKLPCWQGDEDLYKDDVNFSRVDDRRIIHSPGSSTRIPKLDNYCLTRRSFKVINKHFFGRHCILTYCDSESRRLSKTPYERFYLASILLDSSSPC